MKIALQSLGARYLKYWAKEHNVDTDDFGGSAETTFIRVRIFQALIASFIGFLILCVSGTLVLVIEGEHKGETIAFSGGILSAICALSALAIYGKYFKNKPYRNLYHLWCIKRAAFKKVHALGKVESFPAGYVLRKIFREKLDEIVEEIVELSEKDDGNSRIDFLIEDLKEIHRAAKDCLPRLEELGLWFNRIRRVR